MPGAEISKLPSWSSHAEIAREAAVVGREAARRPRLGDGAHGDAQRADPCTEQLGQHAPGRPVRQFDLIRASPGPGQDGLIAVPGSATAARKSTAAGRGSPRSRSQGNRSQVASPTMPSEVRKPRLVLVRLDSLFRVLAEIAIGKQLEASLGNDVLQDGDVGPLVAPAQQGIASSSFFRLCRLGSTHPDLLGRGEVLPRAQANPLWPPLISSVTRTTSSRSAAKLIFRLCQYVIPASSAQGNFSSASGFASKSGAAL